MHTSKMISLFIYIYFLIFTIYIFQTTQDNEKGQRRGLKIMKEKQYKGKEPTKDSSLLAFERFISTQKVSFYSQQMDISNLIAIFSFNFIPTI